jgi:tryptophan synthase alpha chain
VTSLDARLRALRDAGRKALVPYVVAGMTPEWARHVEAAILGGADAVEVGVPFSDPMMDGVVIQEGALRALERGTTIDSICDELATLEGEVPLIAMTYYNLFLHYGLRRCAGRLHEAGFGGTIVPDLSPEESDEWRVACDEFDLASVFLVAPSTPPARLRLVANVSHGFVYAAARMAVTGAASDEGEGARVVAGLREVTDLPVYVGIGVTTPAQAAAAATYGDGVIVGSALVRQILDGATPGDVESFVRTFRDALDNGAVA